MEQKSDNSRSMNKYIAWFAIAGLICAVAVLHSLYLFPALNDGVWSRSNLRLALPRALGGRSNRGGRLTSDTPPPKIALMFLTVGAIPLESIWLEFLGRGAQQSDDKEEESGAAFSIPWDQLFSVYVHPSPTYAFPPTSFFAGREVQDRVNTSWGTHSLLEAERVLLKSALEDPLNTQFVLLSETTIPLYSAAVTYLQLASETKSRINACANSTDPEDANKRMEGRWMPTFEPAGLPQAMWRKSSQWFSLTRQHAEAIVEENQINSVFSTDCWASFDRTEDRFCVSDEHYIPSLLAVQGREQECACDGVATLTVWHADESHPQTFSAQDATDEKLRKELRQEEDCSQGVELEAETGLLMYLLQQERNADDSLDDILEDEGVSMAKAAIMQAGLQEMPARCALFARKVAVEGADDWLRLLEPILG